MRADDIVPIHLSDYVHPETHPLFGQPGFVQGFAIRHPDGLILVDTGIGFGNAWIDEHYQPRSRPVREALRAATLDPDAVRVVVNCHLHFDHSGQNSAFPRVPIVVQQAEWDVAWDEGFTITEWLDFEGARYEKIRGDIELASGVRVLHTPGHTPGHQVVTIETDDGLVLLVGQAAQDAREFATGPRSNSLQRLRDLNAAYVHFAHDRAILRRTPTETHPH